MSPADLPAWVGRGEESSDVLSPRLVQGLRATLDHDDWDDLRRPAPQTSHWLMAPQIAPMRALGPDGHPAKGGFLPPVPLPRRMWAASRMRFLRPLKAGDTVLRRSVILSVEEKSGSTGQLVFVEVGHDYLVEGEIAVSDRHTIVYREAGAPARAPDLHDETADWPLTREVSPSPTMLFRYSALTFNGHRIHYDEPYARQAEGYPGLVVHGPLIATLLVDLCARNFGDEALASFEFRARSPSYADRPIRLLGRPTGNDVELRAVGDDSRILMTATATRSAPADRC